MTSSVNDAWIRFTSMEGPFDWIDVTLMTGPQQGTAAVSVDGDEKTCPTRSPATAQTSIRIHAKARELMIRPKGDGAITVLSVASGTNTSGLIYANVGLPGATVSTIGKWNADFAASDFRRLNPDLIIFEYGTREGFDDALDMKQYEGHLKLAIDQIKGFAPQASILIIGPPRCSAHPGFCRLCRGAGLSLARRAGNGRLRPAVGAQR